MGIVLVKRPDPKEPLQNPAEFMPMHQTNLSRSQRQIPVGMGLPPINEHTAGAIHRFDGIIVVIDRGSIHIFPIIFPVTTFFPQHPVKHYRCFGFHISSDAVFSAPVIQQGIPDHHAFGMEKRHARRFFVKTEEIQRLSDFTVIPFFGFF
jgi:hypothetical protein